jgi:hypothetical protein
VHAGNHLAGVLGDYYTRLQMRFFDHFLKGEDNGWEREQESTCTSATSTAARPTATSTSGPWPAPTGRRTTSTPPASG